MDALVWCISESSPRTRGCFSFPPLYLFDYGVFPAHAGVFLQIAVYRALSIGLPRARGGVSQLKSRNW